MNESSGVLENGEIEMGGGERGETVGGSPDMSLRNSPHRAPSAVIRSFLSSLPFLFQLTKIVALERSAIVALR